jgi:hypothetical protein
VSVDEQLLVPAQHQLPRGRVERGEKFVRGQNFGTGEGIEER